MKNPKIALPVLAIALLGGAASQALFGLAVARWYESTVVGGYFIGLSVVSLVGYVGRFGTEQLALREASPAWTHGTRGEFGSIALMLRRAVVLGTAISIVGTLLIIGTVALIARPDVLTTTPEVWLSALLLAPMNMISTGTALLRASDRLITSISYRYFGIFAPALGLIALMSTIEWLPNSPTLATLVTSSTVALITWIQVHRIAGPIDGAADFGHLRGAASRLTVSTVLNAALTWSDRIILGAILGAIAVSVYGAAWQLVLPFNLIFLLAGTISSPTFSRLHSQNNIAQLETTTRTLSLGMFGAAIALGTTVVAASPFVLRIFGERYEGATTIVAVLVIGQVFHIGSGPLVNLYAMASKEDVLLQVTASSALLSVGSTIGLTYIAGSVGTAAGVTIGLVAKSVALVMLARPHLGIAPVPFLKREQPVGDVGALASLFG